MANADSIDWKPVLEFILGKNPGLSARSLSELISNAGELKIHKRDLNPTLYRNSQIFESRGLTPPCWYLRGAIEVLANNYDAGTPVVAKAKQPVQARAVQGRNVAVTGGGTCWDKLLRCPYPWQIEATKAWKKAGHKGVIEAVTGTGKTFCAIWILHKFIKARLRCLVVVPSVVLLDQWKAAMEIELGLEVTSTLGGRNGKNLDLQCPITLGVVNTVAGMSDQLEGNFHLVVADECHRYGAATFQLALLDSAPYRLGLTATLERSDEGVEEVIHPYFGGICFKYGYREAIDDEVIARYDVLAIGVDLSNEDQSRYKDLSGQISDSRRKLVNTHGFHSKSFSNFMLEVAEATNFGDAAGLTARWFMKAMRERKKIISESSAKLDLVPAILPAIERANSSLVFSETIEAANLISSRINQYGVSARAYHSKLKPSERTNILEDLAAGRLRSIVAVHALDEGIDVPDVDLGIIFAGTKQRRQMIQRIGRVIRKKQDNRKATFIVLYAKDTTEDPNVGDPDDSNLSTINEFADTASFLSASGYSHEAVGSAVEDWIVKIQPGVSVQQWDTDDDIDIPF